MPSTGVGPGDALVIDFDRHHLTESGAYIVDLDGVPELCRFKRFPRGLRVWIAGRWSDVARNDFRGVAVVGRLVGVSQGDV